jgi:hypothetical protein
VDSRQTEGGRRKAEDVDRAIDLAVREMMEVEPRADLRARVLERIERRGSVGRLFRPGVRWTWVAAPLAAAAILVLAVLLRQSEEPLVTRPAMDIVLRALETERSETIAHRDERSHRPGTRTMRPPDRRITAAVATVDDTNFSNAPPPGFAVDALAPPPPIAVEEIPPTDPAAVAELDVAPLRLPALEVNALSDSPRERHD